MTTNKTRNAQPEPDADEPPELLAIGTLRDDINSQVARVKSIFQQGQLTPELAAEEMCETFLPLLGDLADRMYEAQSANEEGFGELYAGKPSEGEDPAGIWPEDAKVLKGLLNGYRKLIEDLQGRDVAIGEEAPTVFKAIDAGIALLDELTIQDDEVPEDAPN